MPNPWGTMVSGSDIYHTARLKTYPGGRVEVLVCDKAIFGGDGWEEHGKEMRPKGREKEREAQGHDVDRAVRRARAQVRDLALCNPFRWFVTLTLDKSRVNRYDMAEITRHLNHWLDNQVRRKGLAYVLVPERHKDGAGRARNAPGGHAAHASGPNGWSRGDTPSTTSRPGPGASRRP